MYFWLNHWLLFWFLHILCAKLSSSFKKVKIVRRKNRRDRRDRQLNSTKSKLKLKWILLFFFRLLKHTATTEKKTTSYISRIYGGKKCCMVTSGAARGIWRIWHVELVVARKAIRGEIISQAQTEAYSLSLKSKRVIWSETIKNHERAKDRVRAQQHKKSRELE